MTKKAAQDSDDEIVVAPPPMTRTTKVSVLEKISGRGHDWLYRKFMCGEIETVLTESGHRLVLLTGPGGWEAYIERQRLGVERDPAEKAAAAKAYRQSLTRSVGAKSVARARARKASAAVRAECERAVEPRTSSGF